MFAQAADLSDYCDGINFDDLGEGYFYDHAKDMYEDLLGNDVIGM
jgi:hypothetical protein